MITDPLDPAAIWQAHDICASDNIRLCAVCRTPWPCDVKALADLAVQQAEALAEAEAKLKRVQDLGVLLDAQISANTNRSSVLTLMLTGDQDGPWIDEAGPDSCAICGDCDCDGSCALARESLEVAPTRGCPAAGPLVDAPCIRLPHTDGRHDDGKGTRWFEALAGEGDQ